MDSQLLQSIAEHYQFKLSMITLAGILAMMFVGKGISMLVPAMKAAAKLNSDTLAEKMQKPNYAANQKWNRKWGLGFQIFIFVVLMPFCVSLKAQPWWKFITDTVIILMVYDFFYYLTHRFVFHDSGFMGGPLKWMHAIHHRQHNPCRWDSSYIHPLEVAIGLGLYVAVIFVLAQFMGTFHVATVIITWTAFTQINLHNHDLWEEKRFPWKYVNYAAVMHHNHHARFTGGNFATITLLFDWMFGTLDDGQGWGPHKVKPKAVKPSAEQIPA